MSNDWIGGLLGIKHLLSSGVEQVVRRTWNFIGVTIVDNPSQDRLDITFTGAGVPTTRQVIAGAGLAGGGALTGDVTLNAVANGDGSIVVHADDIQVGVISDTQHGNRGGGALHANVVSAGAAGFMSGADKAKLDAATSSATPGTIAMRDEIGVLNCSGVDGASTLRLGDSATEIKIGAGGADIIVGGGGETDLTDPVILSYAKLQWAEDAGDVVVQHQVATTSAAGSSIDISGQQAKVGSGGAGGSVTITVGPRDGAGAHGSVTLRDPDHNAVVRVSGSNTLGFHGASPVVKPTITGSRAGNAALASLLTELATMGLITDSTT